MISRRRANFNLIRGYLVYFKPFFWNIVCLLVLMVVSTAASLATPYVLKIIIDDIFPKGNYTQLLWLLSALIVIYVLRITSNFFTEILDNKISQKVIADIRLDMFNNLLQKDILYFKKVNTGDVLYTIVDDVRNIQSTLSSLIMSMLNDVFTLMGIVIMLGVLNIYLTLLSLVMIPFMLVTVRLLTPLIQANYKKIQNAESGLSSFFLQSVNNIRVIKSYSTFYKERDRLSEMNRLVIQSNKNGVMLSALNSGIITFLMAVSPVIVLMLGGKNVFDGTLTLGALVAFIQYVNRIYTPAINIMKMYNQVSKAIVSMERVQKYLQQNGGQKQRLKERLVQGNKQPELDNLVIEDLSITINDKIILSDVHAYFERGKIYGLIGPSGSGKSTLINLLCGFLRPNTGQILINGTQPIETLPNWQEYIGLIEKENQLFSDSIRANIQYGVQKCSSQEYENALELALFKDVLDQVGLTSDSFIDTTGSLLSDGQKQRISIARAFLRKPPLLIFDESTSSLDPLLEYQLLKNIRSAFKDSIILMITHRLSTTSNLDFVYEMNNGRITSGYSVTSSNLSLNER